MPILAALLGAIMTGLVWWLMFGRGLEYIEHRLQERGAARRGQAALEGRREAERQRLLAPVRSVTDPREAAALLMLLVAQARGLPTPEQVAAIERQMVEVLGLAAEDARSRLAYLRHAAERAPSPEEAVDEAAPLLREALTRAERKDLHTMLERVAALHGGPSEAQERIIARTLRRLGETA